MNIEQVEIKNFLTIGEAQIELSGRGLVLVQGENEDDTSAKSNGAGKSSIVDAISWALFGTTARDVTGDDVINIKAGKDCRVFVFLEDDGIRYKVERFRKHPTHKNALMLWQIDTSGTPLDLTKGTDKETQVAVEKIIGCSLEVFVGAIYAGQERMPDLPGMTDKQLKLLIEEAAGVEELAAAYLEARQRAGLVENDFVAAQSNFKSLDTRLSTLKLERVESDEQHKLFEDGRKDRARAELTAVAPIAAVRLTRVAALADIDEAQLLKDKAALEAELLGHRAQSEQLQTIAKEEREIGDKVTRFIATARQLRSALETTEKNLADVSSRVGKPCGECGKAYCEEDLHTVKTLRGISITKAKNTLQEALISLRNAKVESESKINELTVFKSGMTDVSASVAKLSKIDDKLIVANDCKRDIAAHDRAIDAIKASAKNRITEANPWTKAVEAKRVDIERTELALVAASVKLNELEEKRELYADAVKVFGPAGVRAHILDTVTPFLNERTSEYLGVLADGNIAAIWSTLTKTAKGEVREKFNIEVTNSKGGKSFKALSGGEKRKVRLASAMALQDMVASRATKPINLLMADEIDEALDEPGLERLMVVLDKKAKERGTVLIISHNSLTDWCDQVMTVTKKDGYSTVTGATKNGS